MKHLKIKCIAICMFCISFYNAQAQTATQKPSAFSSQPSEIELTVSTLQNLMNAAVGTPISIALNSNFYLIGFVQNSIERSENNKSVIIKLTNYPDMVLSLSKVSDIYTPEKYIGKIISTKYSDCYDLNFENGVYKLKKHLTEHLVQTCHQ